MSAARDTREAAQRAERLADYALQDMKTDWNGYAITIERLADELVEVEEVEAVAAWHEKHGADGSDCAICTLWVALRDVEQPPKED